MPNFIASTDAKLIAGGLLILLILFTLSRCQSAQNQAAQAGQDDRSSEATTATAKEAVGVVIRRSEADASVDDIVEAATKEIDNAPDPKAAGIAVRNAVCRMSAYRDDPACKLP